VVEVTGLRNPCVQIERYARGLLAAVRGRDAGGHVVMRGAVMGIVVESGKVRAGDPIDVRLPPLPHQPLTRV
jgi:MOSC domain-containing protein YiiM